jgi:hypothetical protein
MSTIEVRGELGDVEDVFIDNERLRTDDGETWFLPKGSIGDLTVNDLPESAAFEICSLVENEVIMMDTIPIRVQRVGNGRVLLMFEDSGTRKYWDGKIGFKSYMEAKRQIVEERAAEVGDVRLEHYEDDGAWIHLSYSAEVEADKLETAVQLAEQIVAEVDGAAELRLGGEFWAPADAEDEKAFTLGTVLPIIRKLGFQNVRYHHGKREFGRDILFARTTEFHELEHWGAQVKFGDVAGGADSAIDVILGQIDDAFKMPFYDLYSRQKQRISKLAIIISGRFTENAIEKICEKIENHAARNNILFIDGEKLKTLAERFTRSADRA